MKYFLEYIAFRVYVYLLEVECVLVKCVLVIVKLHEEFENLNLQNIY